MLNIVELMNAFQDISSILYTFWRFEFPSSIIFLQPKEILLAFCVLSPETLFLFSLNLFFPLHFSDSMILLVDFQMYCFFSVIFILLFVQ